MSRCLLTVQGGYLIFKDLGFLNGNLGFQFDLERYFFKKYFPLPLFHGFIDKETGE